MNASDKVTRAYFIETDSEGERRRAERYVLAKLLMGPIGALVYAAMVAPHAEIALSIISAVLADMLFLAPYYGWVRMRPRHARAAARVSLAVGTLVMTYCLHLAGGYTHPMLFGYFLLFILAAIVAPDSRTFYSVAAMITLAYATLTFLEMNALVRPPYTPVQPPAPFSLVYAAAVLAGVWVAAVILARLLTAETHQRARAARLSAELHRRAEAEAIWNTVGKSVISTQNLDQVLTTVVQVISEKMRVETGSILLRAPETDEIYFAKVIGGSTEQFHSVRLRVGQGIVGWVVATGESVIVPDVARDSRWFAGVDQKTGFVTRSILCVPLIAKETVLGAIELLNKQNGTFDQADLQLLESIAAPVAIAIQNAQLHERILKELEERTRLFQLVERAKKEWETSVDALDEGILLVDQHCRILRANRTFAHWLRTTPDALLGQLCFRAVYGTDQPPPECPQAQTLAAPDRLHTAELEVPHLGGIFRITAHPLTDRSGTFIGVVTVLKDVTAEKHLQAQLIQSEKLVALGQLAASLAHEINNPLQAIQGCLDLSLANPSNEQKQQRYLGMAKSEVERLGALVQRMLDLYRPSKGAPEPVHLPALLDDVLALAGKRLQHARIKTQVDWVSPPPPVIAIANQLKQVFLNLVLNAADAMPSGGTLDIQGRLVTQDRNWIVLSFTDSGVGIAPENLDKVFEPFFTTKTSGTGLGLGISQNIVNSHGGRLTVESTLGVGSTFSVWLPIPRPDDARLAPRRQLAAAP